VLDDCNVKGEDDGDDDPVVDENEDGDGDQSDGEGRAAEYVSFSYF
jgi:hypothetical protein